MVYVDENCPCLPNATWRWSTVCHLEADTGAELDAFAAQLGLKPKWKQAPRPPRYPWPHFDITPRRRHAAIRLGAVAQDRYETVERWRRWRRDGWPGAASTPETPSERRRG